MVCLDAPARPSAGAREAVARGLELATACCGGSEVTSTVLLQDFLCQIERCCRQCHLTTPIALPPEHPVEEVGRLLLCCLLKHEDLGMKVDTCAVLRSLTAMQFTAIPTCPFVNVSSRTRGFVLGSYWHPQHRAGEAQSAAQVGGGCVSGRLPGQVLAHQGGPVMVLFLCTVQTLGRRSVVKLSFPL